MMKLLAALAAITKYQIAFIGEHYWIEHCHVWQAKTDFALTCMQVAKLHCPIQYPKPDEVLSFDVPTSLHRFVYTFEFLIRVRLY